MSRNDNRARARKKNGRRHRQTRLWWDKNQKTRGIILPICSSLSWERSPSQCLDQTAYQIEMWVGLCPAKRCALYSQRYFELKRCGCRRSARNTLVFARLRRNSDNRPIKKNDNGRFTVWIHKDESNNSGKRKRKQKNVYKDIICVANVVKALAPGHW